MAGKYTNNATTTLAGSISTSATSISVPAGAGDLFPVLGVGDWCYLTLVKLVGGLEVLEIVKATARAADVFTIVRAQEGTTARTFTAGDKVDLRITAAGMNEKASLDSPAFTGTPTAVTQAEADDTTKIATDAFANRAANTALGKVAGPTVTLASAATVNIGAANTGNIFITGTTTITAFDTVAEGTLRWIVFAGALTLTNNVGSLQLPGLANISVSIGDTGLFKSLGGGNWKCLSFTRIGGEAIRQASSTAAGYLSSTDWNTFNGKQAALGYTPVNKAGDVISGDISLNNNVKLLGKDTGGTSRQMLSYDGSNNVNTLVGTGGFWRFYNSAGAAVVAEVANSGDISTAGDLIFTNVHGIKMKDSGGTARTITYVGADNWLNTFNPGSGVRWWNQAANVTLASLDNSGNFSAITVGQTSDDRKKKSWQDLTDEQLDALLGIDLVGTFEWIHNGERSIGASAQQIQRIVPEAVHVDEEGNLTVNYGGLTFAVVISDMKRRRRLEMSQVSA